MDHQAGLPPTPVASTYIKGRDGPSLFLAPQSDLELPPPAMLTAPSSISPSDLSPLPQNRSFSSPAVPYPIQPAEAVKSRRRASSTLASQNVFALPPPPSRTRKIIQMGPKESAATAAGMRKTTAKATAKATARARMKNITPADVSPNCVDDRTPTNASAVKRAGGNGKGARAFPPFQSPMLLLGAAGSDATAATTAAETTVPATSTPRKQPSTTSAAGRKMARKTAHSLIERRRRSKMNDEFAVLKAMIPACTGEVHKLAILQASIDYIRYLRDCIKKLQASRRDVIIDPYRHGHNHYISHRDRDWGEAEDEDGDGDGDQYQGQDPDEDGDVGMTMPPAPPSEAHQPSSFSSVDHSASNSRFRSRSRSRSYSYSYSYSHTRPHSGLHSRTHSRPRSRSHSPPPSRRPVAVAVSVSVSATPSVIAPDEDTFRYARKDSYSSTASASVADPRPVPPRYDSQPLLSPQHGYTASAGKSPPFGLQASYLGGYPVPTSMCVSAAASASASTTASTTTSPTLLPTQDERDIDRQAMAALLMLNAGQGPAAAETVFRRSSGRSLSVKDLLNS